MEIHEKKNDNSFITSSRLECGNPFYASFARYRDLMIAAKPMLILCLSADIFYALRSIDTMVAKERRNPVFSLRRLMNRSSEPLFCHFSHSARSIPLNNQKEKLFLIKFNGFSRKQNALFAAPMHAATAQLRCCTRRMNGVAFRGEVAQEHRG